MSRQAKVTLTADVKGFKSQIDDAKESLADLQKKISDVEGQLTTMAGGNSAAFDSKSADSLAATLENLKKKYKEITDLQKGLGKGKLPSPGKGGGGGSSSGGGGSSDGGGGGGDAPSGGGGGVGNLLKGSMGAFGKVLGFAGVSLGASALYNKRENIADQRLKMTPLTTDNRSVGETSNLGYTPTERRQTGADIASETQVSSKALTKLTDLSEQLERGYGISKSQTAGAIGVARKAGVDDQGKFVASAIGSAVAAKLEGSKVGEYLASMTGFMESMSQGVNVDTTSLNGFAAAMGTLPFFKNDPSRIFDALRGMSSAFQSNDRFQQAQSARAIIRGAPGASAAAVETRKDMGLFGSVDKETQGNLKKAGMSAEDLQALNMSGGKIIQNEFKEIMDSTKGTSTTEQNYAFAQRTGMTQGQSMPIYAKMAADRADGKEIDFDKVAKQIADATADPQKLLGDRMAQVGRTFGNAEGSIKDLSASLARLGEIITFNLVDPMVSLAQEMRRLGQKMDGKGDLTQDVGDAASGAIAIAGLLAGITTLSGAFGSLAGMGALAAGAIGTLGLGLAGLAGYITGKLLDKPLKGVGSETNDYGQTSDLTERLVAGIAAILPGTGVGVKDYAQTYMAGNPKASTPEQIAAAKGDASTPQGSMPASSVAGNYAAQTGPMNFNNNLNPVAQGAGSNVIQFPTGVVSDNTSAITELTTAIRNARFGQGGQGSRMPSNANQMNRANTAIGK